ncbi:hypothetical protein Sjap_017732 [Stephania japonica]|uniref:Uncharacterized protein n=1 Tax=Stephania japonica TaxID=461633 RepID=A0AAP0NIK3_9MAGN
MHSINMSNKGVETLTHEKLKKDELLETSIQERNGSTQEKPKVVLAAQGAKNPKTQLR